jgi:hypothetical protein
MVFGREEINWAGKANIQLLLSLIAPILTVEFLRTTRIVVYRCQGRYRGSKLDSGGIVTLPTNRQVLHSDILVDSLRRNPSRNRMLTITCQKPANF